MRNTLSTLLVASLGPASALAQCEGTLNYWGIWTADTSARCWFSVGIDQQFDGESTGVLCPPCELDCAQTITADFSFLGNELNDGGPAGFTIGYNPGDFNNPNADYLVVLWPPVTQPDPAGSTRITLYRVQGAFDNPNVVNGSCVWFDNVSVIAQAPAGVGERPELGNDPNNTQLWSLTAEISCDTIRVLDGNQVLLDANGSFCDYVNDGSFCWFSVCQKIQVTPATFTRNTVASSWSNYGTGLAGCNGVPSLTLSAMPNLGTTPDILIGNAGSSSTACSLIFAFNSANMPIPIIGGNLLVGPPILGVVAFNVPAGGATVPCSIPLECTPLGWSYYLQAICMDLCAPQGYALSQGLRLDIGNS